MNSTNIIFKITRKYMIKNKKRTIITLTGIVMIVALLTCIFVGKDTVFSYLTSVAEVKSGKWNVIVYSADREQYKKIKKLDYVKETAVSSDFGFTDCKASNNKNKPYWEVKGYSSKNFEWMNISLEKGDYPKNDSEIIVSKQLISDGVKIKIGDEVSADFFERYIRGTDSKSKYTYFPFFNLKVKYKQTVKVGQDFPYYSANDSFKEIHKKTGISKKYTVVGIMDNVSYESKDNSFYAGLTYRKNSLDNLEKGNISIKFDLDKLSSKNKYINDLNDIMGNKKDSVEVNDLVMIFSANSSDTSLNFMVNIIMIFFIGLIMIISIILIYNVFNISFEERLKYLGMLYGTGATAKQRRSSVYYEALVLLFIALPIGFILGISVVYMGMKIINPYILKLLEVMMGDSVTCNVSATVCINIRNIVYIFAIAFVTVLLSVWYPAFKVGRSSAIKSMKGQAKKIKKISGIGRVFEKTSDILSVLAFRNSHYSNIKTKSVVRSIVIFMFVISITAFGASSVGKMVHYRLVDDVSSKVNVKGYDYVLSEINSFGGAYDSMKNEIIKNASVEKTVEWFTGMFKLQADNAIMSDEYWDKYRLIANEYFNKQFTTESFKKYMSQNKIALSIYAVDDETYENIAQKSGADMKLARNGSIDSVLFYQNIEMSTDNFRFEDGKAKHYRFYELNNATSLSVGDKFTTLLYNPKKDKTQDFLFTLAGYATNESLSDYFTFHGGNAWIITRASTAEKMNRILSSEKSNSVDGNDNVIERELYIKFNDKNSTLAEKLKKTAGSTAADDKYIVTMINNKFSVSTVAEIINLLVNIVAVCFVVFTSLICFLNLFNSVKGRAEMRSREIAMLCSVGMEHRQISHMLFVENVYIITRGLFWTALVSLPVIFTIKRFLSEYFGHIELNIPVRVYFAGLIAVVVSLFGISRYCYKIKGHYSILENLRNENV
ncbi:ABC transporter permease [Eubacterium sp. MSJ-13]|uniref:ABC transporter permease n=1 Tax=Eubacterium sp. MSJ-13 TaxID=2841513 RepID=UPI001C1116C7|nr:ABC transporter permease [Eubacterium sp. MSJ-13]MBU5479585.1 ABC transporter permease [Eubacterium sp. MSJ-13]